METSANATVLPAADPASLERLFFFPAIEESYDIAAIEGTIPEWIRGSCYLNGPARFERAGRRYTHWLDGDGMVCALHFTEDGVRFASRFVQTRKLQDEDAAGAFVYRGFGTAFPGDRLLRSVMLQSPVNVSVCLWGNTLLAFGEQSLPVELHPETLDTIGEFDFGGELNEVSPFAAHAKLDPVNGNLLNFGISYSAQHPMLHVYEFDAAGPLLRRARLPITLPHSNHDFSFTERHAVFFLSPLIMDFGRFLRDGLSVMESLDWEPERGSRIFIAPRHSRSEAPFTVETGSGHCLHLINSFEEDGALVVDILELESPVYSEYQPMPEVFRTAPRCSPVRYVVDLETRTLRGRQAMRYQLNADFPSIDARLVARPYNDFWFLGISATGTPGAKFFDQLAHGSWAAGSVDDVYLAEPGTYFGGEPMFVGHPTEPDEGFIIVQHLSPDTGETAFVMFDAFAVHRGPVVRLPLRNRLHPLFHAAFYPATQPTA